MLTEFTPDIAEFVMKLWIEKFGMVTSVNQRYVDGPNELYSEVTDPRYWFGGCFSNRMGSRWTDDSKLLVHFNNPEHTLVVECYMQAASIMGHERSKEAELAEREFNDVMRTYLAARKG